MPHDARHTALFVLNALDSGRKTLDSVLEDVLEKSDTLSRRDRALLYALVYGVLRWKGRLDWIIGHFSKTRLNRMDPGILNILRLGLFQIMYLSRIPVSAAVNTSVEMAKSVAPPWVARFVNGLLRNAARHYKSVSFPDVQEDAVAALAATKSFPQWLVRRWLGRFGLQETMALCDAINTIPPITVRTNTLRTSRERLTESLRGGVQAVANTHYAPEGICFSHPQTSIPEMEAFQKGWFQVQDEAAQLVTLLLDPQPGETVLDACAGLGGKTGHLAQIMKNRGQIVAMDNDEKKLLRLESEMQRLGVTMVTTLRHDLNYLPRDRTFGRFDRILLDAPCSGLGVLRRNPDTKWSISKKKNLKRYRERQIHFLENLSHSLKPNGVLAFAVCSMEPEETDEVITAFLNNHPDFAMESSAGGLPAPADSLRNQSGGLRTLPHLHNMDGFFAVALRRKR